MHMLKRCQHGQENWCRICGSVENLEPQKEKEKRDYSNDRDQGAKKVVSSIWGYLQPDKDKV